MHVYVMSGTQSGGVDPRLLELDDTYDNTAALAAYNVSLGYITASVLALDDTFNNASDLTTFGVTLVDVPMTFLTITLFDNSADLVSYGATLELIPFVPVNTELTDLLYEFEETYPTTDKIQMDTLITELKDAGVWAKLDWYGNAHWARSEHDALLNWRLPASQTLTKVGSAFWTLSVGLSGVAPTTSNSRYISNWHISDGPVALSNSFAFFTKVVEIPTPMNGLQPIGEWRRDSSGGPSTPNGEAILSLSTIAGTGFSGANVSNGSGDGSFAVSGGGLGVWGVSRSGSAHITVHDGTTVASSTVVSGGSYTDPDGMSVAGSSGLAKRSFPGTEVYWGWGGALTALEFAAIEAAYQTALLPPTFISGVLFIDGSEDYLAQADDDYALVDGP